MMKSLPEHAAILGDALFAIHQSDQLIDIYSYLRLASGIAAVSFEPPASGGPPMCASTGLPPEVSDRLAESWSRFSAVWFAFQAYSDYWTRGKILDPVEVDSPAPEPSSFTRMTPGDALKEPPEDAEPIERICYKISQAYGYPMPVAYEQVLKAFKDLADFRDLPHHPAHVLNSSEGLHLVAQTRHALAMWDLLETDDDEAPEQADDVDHHPHVMLIETATRLTLLTLQMMTLCIFPRRTQLETSCLGGGFGDLEVLDIGETMINLHLEDFRERVSDNDPHS